MKEGTDWQPAGGDDEPPSMAPVPAGEVINNQAKADDEPQQDSLDPWMPLIAVGVAIGSFFCVMALYPTVKAAWGIGTLVSEINESQERRVLEAPTYAAKAASSVIHSALLPAQRQSRERVKGVTAERVTEFLDAAVGDFDATRRDELAKRLLALHQSAGGHQIDDALYHGGAHDVLLSGTPRLGTRWFAAARLHERWDLVSDAEGPFDNASIGVVQCQAGAREAAYRSFEGAMSRSAQSGGKTIVDALACGAASELAGSAGGLRPNPDVATMLAARGRDAAAAEHFRKLTHKTTRSRMQRLEVAAKLYGSGSIGAKELVEVAQMTKMHCTDHWSRGRESVSPEDLQRAIDGLAADKGLDKDQVAVAVSKLSLARALAGLNRGQDTRPERFELDDTSANLCMAIIETSFEPAKAIKRLEAMRNPKLGYRNESVLGELAYAHARNGDFDKAYEVAQELLAQSRPRSSRRTDANFMLIAFGHLTGKIDEVQLSPSEFDHFSADALEAIRGSQDQRRAMRVRLRQGGSISHTAVSLYVHGLLAPGHEEAFLVGHTSGFRSTVDALSARAEAARWRGDEASAEKWSKRLARVWDRATPAHGGIHAVHRKLE